MKHKLLLCLSVLLLAALSLSPAAIAQGSAPDTSRVTTITLADGGIVIDGPGAGAEGSTLTITAAGTYVLSGTLSDGQILVAATKDDVVTLVLNGVQVSCSHSSALYASQADSLTLYLAEGSQNSFSDAVEYVYAGEESEPSAAIYVQDNLTIDGPGSLTVQGNYRNGIASRDDLVVNGGNLTVTAVNDGLRGRDAATIAGGTIVVDAGNDGLKSNNSDPEKGWVLISGGSLTITAGHDGIQAEASATVTGGEVNILAGGGTANAPARAEEFRGGGGFGGGFPGFQQESATSTEEDDTASDSFKGIKAGTQVAISGGNLTIDAADDAVHSNGELTIGGGTLSLSSGDDGIHADGAVVISEGVIQIAQSYEGIEGATITIDGGDISLVASDDGLNAAGGTDGNNGPFGRDQFASNDNYWIVINGGTLVVNAQGDGLDSNGNLTINGGDITVHGPSSGGNGPLDANGEIAVNGGTLIAAGSAGMAETPGSGSTQPSLAIYYTQVQAAGTVVELLDSNGDLLATYTAEKSIQTVLFTLPGLQQGATYSLRTNGQDVTATLSQTVTAINENGEAVTGGGFGGPGGGRGGRGGW